MNVSMEPVQWRGQLESGSYVFANVRFGNAEPLYTAAQMREYRNAALEEAAKVCDEVDKESQSQWPHRFATMIRALKEK